MAYHPNQLGLTEEQESKLIEEIQLIRLRQEKSDKARKIATFAALAGALFAAVRLGIIFSPKMKRRKA